MSSGNSSRSSSRMSRGGRGNRAGAGRGLRRANRAVVTSGNRSRSSFGVSRGGRGLGPAAVTFNRRNSVGTRTNSKQRRTAILIVGKVDVAVVLVVDGICAAQEGIAQHGELIIGSDAEDTEVLVGLFPDEVVVRNNNLGLAKFEVYGAILGANIAGNAVQTRFITFGGSRGTGEGVLDLVEVFGGQGRNGVAAVEKDGLTIGLVEYHHLGAVLLGHRDAVEINPVACELVGGLGGRDDGSLLQVTGELLCVDTAKHDGTSLACQGANIEGESAALDETLRSHIVQNQRVIALPAL